MKARNFFCTFAVLPNTKRGLKIKFLIIQFLPFVTAGTAAEKGYFGPWRQCKMLLYGREWCGQNVSRFQPVCEFRFT